MRSAFITCVLALGLGLLAGLWCADQSKARLQLSYELQITQMQAEQDRLRVAAVLAQAAALQANTDKANLAALLATQEGEKIHVQYRTITQVVEKIIERPVYRSQCLDADGLRQLNDFIRGATDELSTVPALPANLALPCADLPLIDGEDGRAVVQWALPTIQLYRECQAKVLGLQGAWPL